MDDYPFEPGAVSPLVDAAAEMDGFEYSLYCRDLGIWFDDCLMQILQARGGLMGEW